MAKTGAKQLTPTEPNFSAQPLRPLTKQDTPKPNPGAPDSKPLKNELEPLALAGRAESERLELALPMSTAL